MVEMDNSTLSCALSCVPKEMEDKWLSVSHHPSFHAVSLGLAYMVCWVFGSLFVCVCMCVCVCV